MELYLIRHGQSAKNLMRKQALAEHSIEYSATDR